MVPPLDPVVIRERLKRLEENLALLRALGKKPREEFVRDPILQWAVERGLQVSIENALDIGSHLIGAAGLPAPRTYAEVIEVLGQQGILPPEFAARIRSMAGFHNVLVHEYLRVDLDLVYEVLQTGVNDLSICAQHILAYLHRHPN